MYTLAVASNISVSSGVLSPVSSVVCSDLVVCLLYAVMCV